MSLSLSQGRLMPRLFMHIIRRELRILEMECSVLMMQNINTPVTFIASSMWQNCIIAASEPQRHVCSSNTSSFNRTLADWSTCGRSRLVIYEQHAPIPWWKPLEANPSFCSALHAVLWAAELPQRSKPLLRSVPIQVVTQQL